MQQGGFMIQAITAHWCTKTSTDDLVIRSKLAILQYVRPDHVRWMTACPLEEILRVQLGHATDKVCNREPD